MMNIILSALSHTWILDLDGTIVKHNGYKNKGEDSLLPGVKNFFDSIPATDMVVLITSRKIEYKELTEQFLTENNIRYDHIIYDAPYGERILINDNKPSGLEMAKSICLDRDAGMDFEVKLDL